MKKIIATTVFLCLAWLPLFSSAFAKDDPERHISVRISAEAGLGAVIGAASVIPPMVFGSLISQDCMASKYRALFAAPARKQNISSCVTDMNIGIYTALAVYPAAVAGGTLLGGRLTGGRGKVWATFLGAYAGGLLADLGTVFWGESYPRLTAAAVLFLPVVSSVLAYELSAPKKKDKSIVVPLTFSLSF